MGPPPMAGLKRDDISAYALRIGERPVCHPSSSIVLRLSSIVLSSIVLSSIVRHLAWAGLRPVSGVVVFSKLSKLLNREDALSAPCLKHFRNYSGPIRVARCGFSLGENHEKACRFPDFLQRCTGQEQ
jgi:hypothetical protein